jgi:hypothetical protein
MKALLLVDIKNNFLPACPRARRCWPVSYISAGSFPFLLMPRPFVPFLLAAAIALGSCQQTPPAADSPQSAAAQPAGAPSPTEARAAVARYLQSQPNAGLYVLDSARVNDNQASWQVLVPRTDWARRMPNSARFEVDKATGKVSAAPVK